MAAQDKATNKTRFETGDVPTQTHFADLIDSYSDVGHTHPSTEVADETPTVLSIVAGEVVIDFSGNKRVFELTLTENATLAVPLNQVVSRGFAIFVTQDATGGRTLAYNAAWKFSKGSVPTLSTAANAEDLLVGMIRATDKIFLKLDEDYK